MRRTSAAVIAVLIVLLSMTGCSVGPMESAEGNVHVTLPVRHEAVTLRKQADGSWTGIVHTTGVARAFEAMVSWQTTMKIAGSTVSLGQGSFMTSAGAPEFGTFDQALVLSSPASGPTPVGSATLRIFISSMKDGSQQDIVDIPLILHTKR
ncbi:MAG: Gmad2 immunoglobulin-like domain-containing protein [Candidatus Cryosericum sp.]|nr:Gmad2 immunoglobulin-like domain-containing protein [bacterium]